MSQHRLLLVALLSIEQELVDVPVFLIYGTIGLLHVTYIILLIVDHGSDMLCTLANGLLVSLSLFPLELVKFFLPLICVIYELVEQVLVLLLPSLLHLHYLDIDVSDTSCNTPLLEVLSIELDTPLYPVLKSPELVSQVLLFWAL